MFLIVVMIPGGAPIWTTEGAGVPRGNKRGNYILKEGKVRKYLFKYLLSFFKRKRYEQQHKRNNIKTTTNHQQSDHTLIQDTH
jgi:hypothetical protein